MQANELLSQEEEQALVRQIEVGVLAGEMAERLDADAEPELAVELGILVEEGKHAWERMWLSNVRLVAHIAGAAARRYRLPFDELAQEGFLGLGEALMRFDHQRGTRFSTLAHTWISHKVRDAVVTRCGGLHGPVHAWRLTHRARRAASDLALAGASPSPEAIAEALGESQGAVKLALQRRQTTLPAGFDVADPTGEDAFAEVERPRLSFMRSLGGVQRDVLERRFGIDRPRQTLAEVAVELGTSPATVRRIERAALDRARRLLQAA